MKCFVVAANVELNNPIPQRPNGWMPLGLAWNFMLGIAELPEQHHDYKAS